MLYKKTFIYTYSQIFATRIAYLFVIKVCSPLSQTFATCVLCIAKYRFADKICIIKKPKKHDIKQN
jgi:hypothetical protein